MAEVTTIEKALATHQDMLIGVGTTAQVRQGANVQVAKIGLNWLLADVAQMVALSAAYSHVAIVAGTSAPVEYIYDAASTAVEDGVNVITPAHGVGNWVLVPAATGGGQGVYLRATVADTVADTTIPVGALVQTTAYAAASATATKGACLYVKVAGQIPAADGGRVLYTADGNHLDAQFTQTPTVAQYGAIGDGVANDTAAIIAAIAAEPEVHCEAGIYICTSTLAVIANKRITGSDATILTSALYGIAVAADGFPAGVQGLTIKANGVQANSVGLICTGSDVVVADCTIRGFSTNLYSKAGGADYSNVTCGDAANGAVANIGTKAVVVDGAAVVSFSNLTIGGVLAAGNFLNPRHPAETAISFTGLTSVSHITITDSDLTDLNGTATTTFEYLAGTDNRASVNVSNTLIPVSGATWDTPTAGNVNPSMRFDACTFVGAELDVLTTSGRTGVVAGLFDFYNCIFKGPYAVTFTLWSGSAVGCQFLSGGAPVLINTAATTSGHITGCHFNTDLYIAGTTTGALTIAANRFQGAHRVIMAAPTTSATVVGNTSDTNTSNQLSQARISENYLSVGEGIANTTLTFEGTASATGTATVVHGVSQVQAKILATAVYSSLSGVFAVGVVGAITDANIACSGLVANGLYRLTLQISNEVLAGW